MTPYTILCRRKAEKTETVLLENGRLLEYYLQEQPEDSLAGALFLGRVERVLPQVKAAFVKLGLPQNGFLPLREQESFHQTQGNAPLVTGQDVIVQVKKDPRGEKGAFLTRDVVLTGQYALVLPLSRHIGVSRRVDSQEDCARARKTGAKIAGNRFGMIVRHAALFAREEDVREEAEELFAQWTELSRGAACRRAPELLRRAESPLATICRDYAARHSCRVLADVLPREKLPEDVQTELCSPEEMERHFSAFAVKRQLQEALGRKVRLRGGGNLVIDQREALHTIDVNSASQVEGEDGKSLPLSQNLAAVPEIARQIRLRNLSGVILTDMIDMEGEDERREVLCAMEEALRDDRIKTVVHGFSHLGLLEMTRRRTGETLQEILTEPCIRCVETGRVPFVY